VEIKARKIKVEENNPYENDRLDRKPEVDNVSSLLRNISSPIVLSINAPWGEGKTTFLEMLHADLIRQGGKCIFFNAWETDFASDPLLAFLGEMNQVLETYFNDNKEKSLAWEKAKKAGIHILKKGIPALVKIGTAGIIDTEKIIEDESSKVIEGLSKDLIDEYSKNKDDIVNFKENVAEVLKKLEGEISHLYIFVDELDRCRPTYSIELLERIKHLLDIEGLIFILALDKQQLAHSVKGVYGENFEALGYLRRFIDIEYNLRHPELDNFMDQLFATFNFDAFFEARNKYMGMTDEARELKDIFKLLAKSKELSLREVEQLFTKVNLVILSTKEKTYLYPPLLAFLLITYEYHSDFYHNYIREMSTPQRMIKLLYELFPDERERFESLECAKIEGFLIAAKNDHHENHRSSIEAHEKILSDEKSLDKSKLYSEQVLEIVHRPVGIGKVVLKSIVERIEMSTQFKFGGDEN